MSPERATPLSAPYSLQPAADARLASARKNGHAPTRHSGTWLTPGRTAAEKPSRSARVFSASWRLCVSYSLSDDCRAEKRSAKKRLRTQERKRAPNAKPRSVATELSPVVFSCQSIRSPPQTGRRPHPFGGYLSVRQPLTPEPTESHAPPVRLTTPRPPRIQEPGSSWGRSPSTAHLLPRPRTLHPSANDSRSPTP